MSGASPTGAAPGAAELLGLDAHAEHGVPHALLARLRRESPVLRCEGGGFAPFWAVTRHADVTAVSRQPERFRSAPRLTTFPADVVPPGASEAALLKMLLNMDPPEHGAFRALLARHFTPAALRVLEPRVHALAREGVGELAARARAAGGALECDFVESLAVPLPLRLILELLGAPREDAALLLEHSNRVVGLADPEYGRGELPALVAMSAWTGLFQYFAKHVAALRARPGPGLVAKLAASEVDGRPLSDTELLSYGFLLLTAGNETTRNAITGGLLALLEHPGELARLRKDPGLLATAADEIVRWTSPITYFCRTAAEDCSLGGRAIRAGDTLVLLYASANRDEAVFREPFRFDVGRDPNPHLGFGIGEHFCLGASLARLELRAFFAELLRAFETIEAIGPPVRLRSSFNAGYRHLPVRLHAARG
jgi:cytochrome P450